MLTVRITHHKPFPKTCVIPTTDRSRHSQISRMLIKCNIFPSSKFIEPSMRLVVQLPTKVTEENSKIKILKKKYSRIQKLIALNMYLKPLGYIMAPSKEWRKTPDKTKNPSSYYHHHSPSMSNSLRSLQRV